MRSAVVAGIVALGLGALAAHHPGLVFVDFPLFASRAARLFDGVGWGDPLYPPGYPLLLALGHALVGDGLLVGKALSVLATGAIAGVLARTSAPAALAVVAAALPWATIEGTDALAASASALAVVWAVGTDPRRAFAVAAALALAVSTRTTAWAAVPVSVAALAWTDGRRAAAIGLAGPLGAALLAGLAALAVGESPWPDPSLNLAIGDGRVDPTLWHRLARWPWSTLHADGLVLAEPLALIGLGVVAWTRDPRALALLALAASHTAGLGFAFANERLVLPARLALAAALLATPARARPYVVAGAVALLGWRTVTTWRSPQDPLGVAAIVAAIPPDAGEIPATSPAFHRPVDGWPLAAPSVREIAPPETLDVDALIAGCHARGWRYVALEEGRVRTQWKGLRPLLSTPPGGGFVLAGEADGWRIVAVPAR